MLMYSIDTQGQNSVSKKSETFTVRITVLDSLSKETIIGSALQMKNIGLFGVTDMNGVATFGKVSKGPTVIDISCLGYQSKIININVTGNINLTVKLIETSLQLKDVTVVARKNESIRIFRIVKDIDPNAFVSQASVIGVYGEGFDVMKGK